MTAATSPRSSPTPGTFAAGWHPSGSKNGSNKPAATVLQIPAGHAVPWHKPAPTTAKPSTRSEEHTSELQSLMRSSYAVFCLKKKKDITSTNQQRKNRNQ